MNCSCLNFSRKEDMIARDTGEYKRENNCVIWFKPKEVKILILEFSRGPKMKVINFITMTALCFWLDKYVIACCIDWKRITSILPNNSYDDYDDMIVLLHGCYTHAFFFGSALLFQKQPIVGIRHTEPSYKKGIFLGFLCCLAQETQITKRSEIVKCELVKRGKRRP